MRRILLLLQFSIALVCSASRQVTDQLGRVVTVPDHPHRIVCIIPSVVDDAYALGAGDDIIAISDYTRYPKEALQKPSIGLPLTPSIENVIAFHPDLVLGSGDSNRNETVLQLEHLGIPVFMLNPHGIEGVLTSITILGDALNRQERAREVVSALRARVEAVRRHSREYKSIPVFVPIWYSPVISIGRRAFMTEIVEAAGAHSVTDDIAEEWPQVSLEAVVARSPQALVLKRDAKMTFDTLAQLPGWNQLPAIQNHRVYYTDERMELPSVVMFDAMEDLAKQLHP